MLHYFCFSLLWILFPVIWMYLALLWSLFLYVEVELMSNFYCILQVKAGDAYFSCCVVVKNMQRCVYAIPNGSLFHSNEVIELEQDAEKSRISSETFHTKLHVSIHFCIGISFNSFFPFFHADAFVFPSGACIRSEKWSCKTVVGYECFNF